MTVKSRVMDDSKGKRRQRVFYYEEKGGETDQESVGSSEEAESPRSVARIGRWAMAGAKKPAYVHSQVLRIREEDSHIGEDLGEGCPHTVDVVIFSKPILPASPLSGKYAHGVHRGD